jgi:hypothetical protein
MDALGHWDDDDEYNEDDDDYYGFNYDGGQAMTQVSQTGMSSRRHCSVLVIAQLTCPI